MGAAFFDGESEIYSEQQIKEERHEASIAFLDFGCHDLMGTAP